MFKFYFSSSLTTQCERTLPLCGIASDFEI
ncbi:hypothetical protein GETHLI_33530 [Geothrix limicola]|uniref:Uncharacterized protein n=1 Tax=Geothrix limicola TaxID=2927978 RepID=A0ABQ5QJW0_9BACT|nr:hypothetical protein GETHLI_33530 [Geothrix limicola]